MKKTSTLPEDTHQTASGIVERQRQIGGRLLGPAIGQQLLDDEPRRIRFLVGRPATGEFDAAETFPSSRSLSLASPRNGMIDCAGAVTGFRISEKRPDRGPGSA